ncbi:hypothetical protein Rsub_04460 [Raphidocelis subcapitata]|uniref:K Homology domain-containing protein n=1 Tax=Raphidocelis subcapitata TaxID=307507 RepID=A0A2V0P2N8_9CHLO|nr:hypothetical protein Rsub_04460 [Raphidocelis subcapitata]|eukprot:GBF92113.1 hypothetical protein Rsub_04460 [Raphidocelis subcapitata]
MSQAELAAALPQEADDHDLGGEAGPSHQPELELEHADDEAAGAAEASDAVANLSLSGGAGDVPSGGQQVVAKLLISNAAAGSVIGKAGQTIEQIQKNSGARVQLSRAGEFYPGTSERVLLLSGPLHSVLTAVFLSLEKLPREPTSPLARGGGGGLGTPGGSRGREDVVKLAVSRKLCGAVIGQKGATIRDFMSDSGATIRVQPLSELTPSDSERIISVSGSRDRVLRAVALILNTLSADDKFSAYMDLTLQLASTQGLIPAVRASTRQSTLSNARAVLTMALLDEDVGAILGKRGQTLTQIQQNAKVAIKISDRSKMDPHTHEREVTLSGSYAGIQLACAMIAEKLSANRPRVSEGGGGDEDLGYEDPGVFY